MRTYFLFAFFTLTFCLSMNSCTGLKPASTDSNFDKTRILVTLQEHATPERLIAAFNQYELRKEGPASRTFNEWLFSFNVNSIPADDLLGMIRSSALVEKASFPEKYSGGQQ